MAAISNITNDQSKSPSLPDNWFELTSEQKRQYRINEFLNPNGINFISSSAEKAYKVRAQRLIDVYNVQEPDRVPVNLPVSRLPYLLQGMNTHDVMYDYNKAVEACKVFNARFSTELDCFVSPDIIPGRVLDLLEYKLYAWPGHGLPVDASGFQYIEGEYMTANEYDALICDPSNFWIRTYLPRVFGSFNSFRYFDPVTNITEIVNIRSLSALASPEFQETMKRLLDIGEEYQRMIQSISQFGQLGIASGFPVMRGGAGCKAPFDILGDTLRGTHGIMIDIFRRPDKLLEALDKIADLCIDSVLNNPNISKSLMVMYPLHKGADGWMSEQQFETFYWPSLKKVMNAFINEGLIQFLFAEGSFNTRLETVNEFPKGSVIWYFDRTDMFKAKRVLGNRCCIQGNVPASLLIASSPRDVKQYCRQLIEGCGKGGGYILSAGTSPESPKLDNVRAMLEAAKEYGKYR